MVLYMLDLARCHAYDVLIVILGENLGAQIWNHGRVEIYLQRVKVKDSIAWVDVQNGDIDDSQ